MILLIKHKIIIYRRYAYDIWGFCHADWRGPIWDKKNNKVKIYTYLRSPKSWLVRFFFLLDEEVESKKFDRLRRYIYRIDIITRSTHRKPQNKKFISLRLARLYFLTLADYQFRNLFKKASKLDGNLDSNYCMLIECRLLSLLYRTNLLFNFFDIIKFIKHDNIIINYKYSLNHINAIIPRNAFITFRRKTEYRMKAILIKRLKRRSLLFSQPRFIFVSYKYFFFYLCKLPYLKDIVYPISMDISRLTGYGQ